MLYHGVCSTLHKVYAAYGRKVLSRIVGNDGRARTISKKDGTNSNFYTDICSFPYMSVCLYPSGNKDDYVCCYD